MNFVVEQIFCLSNGPPLTKHHSNWLSHLHFQLFTVSRRTIFIFYHYLTRRMTDVGRLVWHSHFKEDQYGIDAEVRIRMQQH